MRLINENGITNVCRRKEEQSFCYSFFNEYYGFIFDPKIQVFLKH